METSLKKLERLHRIVCEVFEFDYYLSLSRTRKREIVEIRYTTIYCALKLGFKNKFTLHQIGDYFGMHHATIIHAKKSIENLIETSDNYFLSKESISKTIDNICSKFKQQEQICHYIHTVDSYLFGIDI